jgi:hypothetical protein
VLTFVSFSPGSLDSPLADSLHFATDLSCSGGSSAIIILVGKKARARSDESARPQNWEKADGGRNTGLPDGIFSNQNPQFG